MLDAAFLPLSPQAVEAAALRRRQIAHRGPTIGQRKGAEPPAATAEPPEDTAGKLDQRMIEGRPAGCPGPQGESRGGHRWVQLLGKLPLPPVPPHLRQRRLDPTPPLALSTKSRRHRASPGPRRAWPPRP